MNEQEWTVAGSDVDEVQGDEVQGDEVQGDSGGVDGEIEVLTEPESSAADSGDEDSELEDVLVLEVVDDALVLPVWEPTGVARVDEALDELTRLDPDDVHHHAEVFDTIHQRLRGTLSDLDTPV